MTKETRALTIVAVLAAAAYANSLGNGFVWDDNTIVLGDSSIQDLSNVPSFFARSYWGEADPEFKLYRPLVTATLAVDWAIGGGIPLPFHATNVLLHVLATLLVFLLFREACAEPPWAFLGAALFAVHPVHADAVDSIVQRAEVLSTIGVVGGLLAAIRGRWVLLALCAAVGAFSKETAATLPLLIAAWHLLGDRARRPRWPAYAISLGVLAACAVARWRVLGGVATTFAAFGDAPLRVRALTMTAVIGDYVRLLVLPYPLCADYAVNVNPHARVSAASDPRFLSAACVLVALALLWAVAVRRRWHGALWGAWAAIAILPVANVIPIGAVEAERFLYLPSVGACALLASLLGRPQARGAGLFVVALFGALTVLRNPVWKDDATLLEARMADAPQNAFPYYFRAVQLANGGNPADALPLLDHAIEVWPEFERARSARAFVFFCLGDFAAAVREQEAVLAADADRPQGWANLALYYASMGDREKVDDVLTRMDRAGHPADVELLFELHRRLSAAGR